MGEFANGAFEDDVMKVDHSKGISLYKRRHEGELIFSLPCNSTMKMNTDPTPKKWLPSCLALGLPILQTVLSRARDLRKDPADARQVFYYWHFVILFVFICLGQSACPPHLTCWGEGQRTILRSQFSPSTRSILELELRLPGLVASTLTYRATLPNLDFFFIVSQGLTTLASLALESWSSFSASQAAGITAAAQTWLLFSRVMGI